MVLARASLLFALTQGVAAQSVSCGNTYTFSIDRPEQKWRPRFCRWGSYTLHTCGAGKTRPDLGGCSQPFGTLADTVIEGTCRNDDSWGTANSCCSHVASGCSNLEIGGARGSTGYARLSVCCEGCPSCSSGARPLPATLDQHTVEHSTDESNEIVPITSDQAEPMLDDGGIWDEQLDEIIPDMVAPNMSAAYQSPDLQPDGFSGVGVPESEESKADLHTKFFLPLDKEVAMIRCNQFEVRGRAMPSALQGDTEQWFKQVRVLHNGNEMLSVGTVGADKRQKLLQMETQQIEKVSHQPEKGSAAGTGSSEPQYPLSSLDVAIEGVQMQHTTTLSKGPAQLSATRQHGRIGGGWVESVTFDTADVSIELRSAVAQKFMSERDRVEHLHVDMQVTNLALDAGCSGVLPEMWGMAPMTQETARLLSPPTVDVASQPDMDPASTSEVTISDHTNLLGASGAAGPPAGSGDMWG